MPTYISLLRLSGQGAKAIKDSPKRREAAAKTIESLGGKLVHTYLTMGRYDFVAIIDAPDDDAAAKFALITGGQGNVSTETMRAFSETEFESLLKTLP
jgi:uncharacterized protein with GYD domain